jgi:hypothetical protein
MHSRLVKGDLSAKEKEKAATELFELDVNKSATKKAKTGKVIDEATGGGWNRRACVRAQQCTYRCLWVKATGIYI